MIALAAFVVVLLPGCYFLALAAVALTAPAVATRYLLAHAASPSLHYLELLIRLAIGTAFVLHSPHMRFPPVFSVFGWVLVATTTGLLAVPWRWHRRFAERSVPRAVRYLRVIAIASIGLGSFILVGALATK